MRYIYSVEDKPIYFIDVMFYQSKVTREEQQRQEAMARLDERMIKKWREQGYSEEEIEDLKDRFL